MTNIVHSSNNPSSTVRSVTHSDFFTNLEEWVSNLVTRSGNVAEIKIDLIENDNTYTIHADIPGVSKDDIKVQVDGSRVSIIVESKEEVLEKEGEIVICRERHYKSNQRTIDLVQEIDEENTHATYKNGVLKLTLPKKVVRTFKQIEVK